MLTQEIDPIRSDDVIGGFLGYLRALIEASVGTSIEPRLSSNDANRATGLPFFARPV